MAWHQIGNMIETNFEQALHSALNREEILNNYSITIQEFIFMNQQILGSSAFSKGKCLIMYMSFTVISADIFDE